MDLCCRWRLCRARKSAGTSSRKVPEKLLLVAIGQRYSILVHLNQTPGRASTLATCDMVQIIQGQAILSCGNNQMEIVGDSYLFINGSAKPGSLVLNESLNPFPGSPTSSPQGRRRLLLFHDQPDRTNSVGDQFATVHRPCRPDPVWEHFA
jgi:hypothetical protein